MKILLTNHLARAIVDLDDIAYYENLGPRTAEAEHEWKVLVRLAARLFNLQPLSLSEKVYRERGNKSPGTAEAS